jgi:hypothetical protein
LQQYSRGIHKVGATVSVGVAAHPAPTNIDALLARAARPHGNGHEAGRPWEKGRRAGEKPALQSGEEAITQRNSVLNEDCARMVND